MAGPTKNQQAMLDAINDLTARGLPPTFEELRVELGLRGRGQVSWYLEKLKEKGLVEWDRRQQRSIRVLEPVPPPVGYKDMTAGALQSVIQQAAQALASRAGAAEAEAVLLSVLDEVLSTAGDEQPP
jgi:SOS-response transcriptional repressor LexA